MMTENNETSFPLTKKLSFKKLGKFLLFLSFLICLLNLIGCQQIQTGVLNPKGLIAEKQRQILFDATALMLIVVIPVFIMSFVFVFRYRASRKASDYKPNWGHSVLLEMIWWLIPCGIIIVLAVMTWIMTHRLDPYRSITNSSKSMLIQAVALPWKWLFIYPKENIATVNFLEIPKQYQIVFWLTSDNVPMSAFFIPQLGSQIYTMAGMRSQLHLQANAIGTLTGLNAQYNGAGFSDMHFKVKVVSSDEMQRWINQVKKLPRHLTDNSYRKLLKPTINAPIEYFSSVKSDLFRQIIDKYKMIGQGHPRKFLESSLH